jgi:phosphatidate cytidylyltransferase
MKVRVLTAIGIGAVGIPLVIFSQYIIFPIALAILSLMAVFEILRVLGVEKRYALSLPAYLVSLVLPFFSYGYFTERVGGLQSFLLIEALTLFALLIYYAFLSVFSGGKLEYKTVSQALTAVIYVTVSFSSLCQLRYLEWGGYLFALVFIGAWTCDTFAYFTGMLFGKHKLCPVLSPKKTVEGSVGGTLFAVGGFLLYGFIIESLTELCANYLVLALSGLFVAVVSQLGDLFASLIKREYGVKDYSKLLPGHGGIMDRFDSIIAVSTVLLVISIVFPPFAVAG